jgi:hypothetical protein
MYCVLTGRDTDPAPICDPPILKKAASSDTPNPTSAPLAKLRCVSLRSGEVPELACIHPYADLSRCTELDTFHCTSIIGIDTNEQTEEGDINGSQDLRVSCFA